MISKLHVAETTIDSLNQQLVELSRSESLTRAKEQHESVVNAMKKKHEEQVLALKQKLDEAVSSRDYKVPQNVMMIFYVISQDEVKSSSDVTKPISAEVKNNRSLP